MEVTVTRDGDVNIVTITGEIDAQNANDVHAAMEHLLQEPSLIVMDVSGLTYITSAGLRLMLLIYRGVSDSGGRMVLVGLSDNLQEMMSATGFLDYFTTVNNFEEAAQVLFD